MLQEIQLYINSHTNHDNSNINTCICTIQSHIDNIHLNKIQSAKQHRLQNIVSLYINFLVNTYLLFNKHVIKPFLLLYYMHILYYYIQLIINKLMRYTSLGLRPYRSYRQSAYIDIF